MAAISLPRRRRFLRIALLVGAAAAALPAALAASSASARAQACPWMNPSKSPAERAHELVAAMSLDDKIQMVHGDGNIFTYYGVAGHIPANPALCIPELLLNDAGAGVGDGQINTTAFPAPIAQAATWDRMLQAQTGRAIGWEAWHKGIDIMLAPDVNIARVPMNGRNFEAFGEDPYLAGETVAAEIAGIQQEHVIATVKHFALNNQETDRDTASSDVAERPLHEIYMPAFERAVKKGRVGAVMCSYNRIDSIYACEQPSTLRGILKGEFGFPGFVMSDWGATHSTVAAAKAGLDMEMWDGTYFGEPLKEAVQNGDVPMSRLDDMVFRIVRSMFDVGVFDDPPPAEPGAYAADVSTPDDVLLERRVAEDGSVLLKNQGAILPLTGTGKTIAVIGTAAGQAGANLVYGGGGSSHVPLVGAVPGVVSPLQGIQQTALANGDKVVYADGSATADAVAAASAADVAVVFANDAEAEGSDRQSLSLGGGACTLLFCVASPVDQDELIASVAAANPKTVVVLQTGGPVLMPWLGSVKAVLETWYPGQEDGNAVAAQLLGEVNPSGKLPQTFPRSERDLPTQTPRQYPGVNGHVEYSEGLLVGYRWYDRKDIEPLFPFGHGLSYTTFRYSGLTVTKDGDTVELEFRLTNTGSRAGAEVAQAYVRAPGSTGEPPRQLKAYAKVFLQPGQQRLVRLTLAPRAFAFWDTSQDPHGWTIADGDYSISIGSSSRDLRLHADVHMPAERLGP
jgi:beta-glucosidase